MRRSVPRVLAFVLLGALVCCGDDAPRAEPGPYVAQEVWVTYNSPAHRGLGRRTGLTRDEALRKATDLRTRALSGEDVGLLARQHSNAPGGMADGFSSWRAQNPADLDERDRALVATPIGGVTPIVEWLGGWWFAKRIPAEDGRRLQARFEHLSSLRAKIRAIAVVWKGSACLSDEDRITRTKEQAHVRIAEAFRKALDGEDFGDLARRYSDDRASRDRSGLVLAERPSEAEWLRVVEEGIDPQVLEAAFQGEIGRVWPAVIESDCALFVVRVEERKIAALPRQ